MPVTTQLHPLDPLSAEEMAVAMATLRREHELSERTLVISIELVEPDKATLHAHAPGDAVARTAAIVLVDCVAETTCEATVSISDARLLGFRVVEGRQAAIIGEEYEACEQLVKAHPDFAAALARRGSRIRRWSASIPSRPGRTCLPISSAGGSAAASCGGGRRPGRVRTGSRSRGSSRSST